MDGVRFDVLYPIHDGASDNHASCVLRVWAQGQALLLTGDAELADEDAMLAHWQPDALPPMCWWWSILTAAALSARRFYRRCACAKR
ncbi:MAG: hypothetical protein U1E47_08405 [Rivihabitans pingtungensis]